MANSSISLGSRNTMNHEIDRLIKSLKMSEEQIKQTTSVLKGIIREIKSKIKMLGPFYNEMFIDVVYTGSYFEGLRVREATEFDLNFVITLPKVPKREVQVIVEDCPAGHAKYKIITLIDNINNMPEDYKPKLKKLVDKDQHVIPDEVRKFFQSILDRISVEDIRPSGVIKISKSSSGPARTLYIHLSDGTKVDVDLVPVFSFQSSSWPSIPGKKGLTPDAKCPHTCKWFLVPKDYKQTKVNDPREPKKIDIFRLWRIHYPNAENSLFESKKTSKPIVRLLKDFRDKQNMTGIASYFLKTVVYHEIEKHKTAEEWQDAKAGDRLLESLESLKAYLDKGFLPHIMFPSNNLFRHLSTIEMANYSSRLAIILKKIKEKPLILSQYFTIGLIANPPNTEL